MAKHQWLRALLVAACLLAFKGHTQTGAPQAEPTREAAADQGSAPDRDLPASDFAPQSWLDHFAKLAPRGKKVHYDVVMTIDHDEQRQITGVTQAKALKFLRWPGVRSGQLVEVDFRMEVFDTDAARWRYHTVGYFQGVKKK